MAQIAEWQSRPLTGMYPVVFFRCTAVKSATRAWFRNTGRWYWALGFASDGTRDVLGLWIEANRGG